jgi:hypothetical protein
MLLSTSAKKIRQATTKRTAIQSPAQQPNHRPPRIISELLAQPTNRQLFREPEVNGAHSSEAAGSLFTTSSQLSYHGDTQRYVSSSRPSTAKCFAVRRSWMGGSQAIESRPRLRAGREYVEHWTSPDRHLPRSIILTLRESEPRYISHTARREYDEPTLILSCTHKSARVGTRYLLRPMRRRCPPDWRDIVTFDGRELKM